MPRPGIAGGSSMDATPDRPLRRSGLPCRIAPALIAISLLMSSPALSQPAPPGSCPGGTHVDEGEGCGPQVNDGCDNVNPQFTEVECGDLVCASTWASGGFRDIDWYQIDIQDTDGSGSDRVTFEVRSSVPLLAHVHQSCFDPPVQVQDCQLDLNTSEWVMDIELCAPMVSSLYLRLVPGFMGSGPIVEGIPCGTQGAPYYFNVVCEDECDETLCPECLRAPEGMIAWWMLDEAVGASQAADVVANHNATYRGAITVGTAGQVDQAVTCDGVTGHLSVPDAEQLNFRSLDDFSLMGWINITGGAGIRAIFAKPDAYVTNQGWSLVLNNDNRLVMSLRDDLGGSTNVVSVDQVPPNRWVHVAVTIDRDSATGVNFYINGALAGSGDPTAASGNLTNTQTLTLGAWDIGSGPEGVFAGGLDELMILDYEVSNDVIRRMSDVGCGGVCKQRLHVERISPFCDGDPTSTAIVTIFNDRPISMSYDLTLDGVPANGSDCTIHGPTVFSVDLSNPIVVRPLDRQQVIVTMDRPQGMVEDGDAGCWRASLEDALRIAPLQVRRGFATQSDSICVEAVPANLGVKGIPIGQITPFEYIVHNRSTSQYQLKWIIRALDSVSGEVNTLIQLDLEEPGDPVQGLVNIPANGSAQIDVDVQWTFDRDEEDSSTKGKLSDMVMYEDPGKIEPDQGIGSKGGESTETAQSTACNDGDIDCDGDVDVDDLLELIAAYGECADTSDCPEDIDGDGDVDVDDLLILLAEFGQSE